MLTRLLVPQRLRRTLRLRLRLLLAQVCARVARLRLMSRTRLFLQQVRSTALVPLLCPRTNQRIIITSPRLGGFAQRLHWHRARP